MKTGQERAFRCVFSQTTVFRDDKTQRSIGYIRTIAYYADATGSEWAEIDAGPIAYTVQRAWIVGQDEDADTDVVAIRYHFVTVPHTAGVAGNGEAFVVREAIRRHDELTAKSEPEILSGVRR